MMNEGFPLPASPVFLTVLVALAIFATVVTTVVAALIFCKICSKAGYHWALGLLVLIPFGNLFLPVFLAFGDWPARKELRDLRQRLGIVPGQDSRRM